MVYTIRNEIFPSNTYLLTSQEKCIVIDPGLNFDLIDAAIIEKNLIPIAIIATHGHFDHIGSAQNIIEKYNIPFYIHKADYKMTQSANFFLKIARINHMIKTPKPSNIIQGEHTILNFDGFFPIEITNFEGHSDGSCVIQYENYIFTGDMIYANCIIPNSFPGENLNKLRDSIVKLFNSYPDETIVYPGHGRSATLKEIKDQNKDLEKFLSEQ